jgi:hypothetical protein
MTADKYKFKQISVVRNSNIYTFFKYTLSQLACINYVWKIVTVYSQRYFMFLVKDDSG